MKIFTIKSITGLLIVIFHSHLYAQSNTSVKIWEEPLTLPTYLVEPPDVNPMFFRSQSYQGASRVIYPYALEDNLTNIKEDKVYKALYIENEYIKLCVLPEIGGRLFYATDKTNGYEIFYRQHVIKPANIGMLGAWISGGIEFCVFHHHRASTNIPVDYTLRQNEDGSATIWIGETEPRHRMKWTLGISLFPGKSYIEVSGRLINPTDNINSILYWANVATHVNDDYQVFFPPSTDFAVYHAKNSFSHWPITTEVYNRHDYYKNAIDASWWKNHPEPISFFAHQIKEGFLAGYDYRKNAGTMHVANQNIVTGAKLWEWGPGAYGTMWDSQVLTDSDGPYAELMAGAYSDNQPDYSWLKPYEVKKFKQYWYPIRNSEGATTANLNGMLNLKKLEDSKVLIAANTTSLISDATIILTYNGKELFKKQINISPEKPYNKILTIDSNVDFNQLQLSLTNTEGKELVSYQPETKQANLKLPEVVKPPLAPEDIESLEELYLTGLRIKQFHNARLNPVDYFQEALERDPLDSRCNNQMGIYHKQKGNYEKAKKYFRNALTRLTKDYTHPRDCESFYHLGLILKSEGYLDAAYDTLYHAVWDQSFASGAYFNLAEISLSNKNISMALEEVNRSLAYNNSNLNAFNLKAAILRKMERKEEALEVIQHVLSIDILNFMAWYEYYLLLESSEQLKELTKMMRDMPESYLELAVSYLNAGLLTEALDILELASQSENVALSHYPTIFYYLGYINHKMKRTDTAKQYFEMAEKLSTDYCFPYRLETEKVYMVALDHDPNYSMAWYYLGNLLYDKQPERAINCWEKSVGSDPHLAIAYRNLGWGYNQTYMDIPKAIAAYETAIDNDPTQSRYFYELDRLYEINGAQVEKRYNLLVKNHDNLATRKDALLQEIKVLVLSGEYDTSIDYLLNNFFPRQEGVDNLHDIYVDAFLLKGLKSLRDGDYDSALSSFKNADTYPENHQIGRNDNYGRNAQIYYLQATALKSKGNRKEASKMYEKVVQVKTSNPEYLFYIGQAKEDLGNKMEAEEIFDDLIKRGEKLTNGETDVDFFSKFGEGASSKIMQSDGNFLIGLGYIGKKNIDEAIKFLTLAETLNPNHLWAREILIGL